MISLGIIPHCYPVAEKGEVGPGTLYPLGFSADELAALYWKTSGIEISMRVSVDEATESQPDPIKGSGNYFFKKPWTEIPQTSLELLCGSIRHQIIEFGSGPLFRIDLTTDTGGSAIFDPLYSASINFSEGYRSGNLYFPAIRMEFPPYSTYQNPETTSQPVDGIAFGKTVTFFGSSPFVLFYESGVTESYDSLQFEFGAY